MRAISYLGFLISIDRPCLAAAPGSTTAMLGKRHQLRKIRLRVSQNAAALLFEPGTVDIR
jgi:hypothetical protein